MIKAGIIGSTGYAGGELVRILTGHKDVEIKWFGSRSYIDKKYADVYRNMFQIVDAVCLDDNMEQLADQVDVIFTATPQGLCASLVNEEILSKVKIIDLSADFRIKDVKTYEKWYGIEHKSPQFIEEAVYGLCEVNREDIKGARLIANPGCYTTCSILTAYPLAKEGLIDMDTLIIDAKSGTSGAGRGAKVPNLYCEVNENMKAYGVATHRHTPEIEEQLGYASGKDFGRGLNPDDIPDIFSGICHNTGSVDSHKGMGIGLSICKTIIDAHSGYIEAKNHTNGALFLFTLPKDEEENIPCSQK